MSDVVTVGTIVFLLILVEPSFRVDTSEEGRHIPPSALRGELLEISIHQLLGGHFKENSGN